MAKLVLLSDTHTQHKSLKVPDGDILIHSGDFSYKGEISETKKFLNWFNSLSHPYKIFISGNHDFLDEKHPNLFKELLKECCSENVYYLNHSAVNVLGINFFGSPYTPYFGGWAFNVQRGESIKKYWDQIPGNTDVLITHGPPHMILDSVEDNYGSNVLNVGCEELAKTVRNLSQLKLHVFGHVHGGAGMCVRNYVKFVNASVVNEDYKVVNNPLTINVEI